MKTVIQTILFTLKKIIMFKKIFIKTLSIAIIALGISLFVVSCQKETSESIAPTVGTTVFEKNVKPNDAVTEVNVVTTPALPPWSFRIRVQGATTPQTIYMHEVGSYNNYFPITSSTAFDNINAFYFAFDFPNLYTKIDRNKTYELCSAPVTWTGHMTRFKFDTCYPSWSGNYVNSNNIERLWYIAGNSRSFLYAYPTITCGTIQIL